MTFNNSLIFGWDQESINILSQKKKLFVDLRLLLKYKDSSGLVGGVLAWQGNFSDMELPKTAQKKRLNLI